MSPSHEYLVYYTALSVLTVPEFTVHKLDPRIRSIRDRIRFKAIVPVSPSFEYLVYNTASPVLTVPEFIVHKIYPDPVHQKPDTVKAAYIPFN